MPIPVVFLVVIVLAAFLFLKHLRAGRYIYAVGGNENAARAAGINVDSVKVLAYSMCGGLAGVAGVVLAARTTTGQPNAGVGYELDAIAAAVIGGTSLSGGVGGVGGTILGAVDRRNQQRLGFIERVVLLPSNCEGYHHCRSRLDGS